MLSLKPPTASKGLKTLSAREVLGLTDKTTADWARLRAFQFSSVGHFTILRIVGHVVASIMLFSFFVDMVGPRPFIVWGSALIACLYWCTQIEQNLKGMHDQRISEGELRHHVMATGMLGVLWAVPTLYLGFFGTFEELMVVNVLVMIMAMGSGMSMSAPPLGTLTFTFLTACGCLIGLLFQEQVEMAAVVVIYTTIILVGTIERSRIFLGALIAESEMVEKQQVVSLLLREYEESGADWLWELDPSRNVRSVSPRFAFALGMSKEEAEGRRFIELVAGKDWRGGVVAPSLHDLAERLARRESFSNLTVEVEIDGQKRWWELSGTTMLDDSGRYIGFRGVGSDVTEQRVSSEKIAYLARYDTLTQLPNRLLVNEQLKEALRYSAQWRSTCAFLMLDLDRFKAVNDTLGHQIGDKLLAEVARRLTTVLDSSQMCGRLGGDEFGIVIREFKKRAELDRLARSIISLLTEPFSIDGHTLYVGTSVGTAVGPRDGATVEQLMRNADLALYEAKNQGGGAHCFFETKLHVSAEERHKLEISLRKALDRNELRLQFQPVVRAHGESVVSCEALLRWQSAEHGFISPVKFIPIAEDTRLIVPIGRWVMREACLQAIAWPDHVMVNVNVSPPQLLEPDFVTALEEVLRETGLAPHRLEIEVTESVFLSDANVARVALEKVIALGCSVALDDFGTGYSSLGYLKTLKFSTIKIDRLFVQGAAQGNRESLAIIRAVVAMTESLGMTTTAEGVETADEAALIRSLGCTKIQGYYFGRPLDAPDAMRAIERNLREAPRPARVA